jgi:hypothetical protein
MVATEVIVRDWVEGGENLVEIVTGWKMDRKRGKARNYSPCVVTNGRRAPAYRHSPTPSPTAGVPATPGDTVTGCGCECRAAADHHTGRIMPLAMMAEMAARVE